MCHGNNDPKYYVSKDERSAEGIENDFEDAVAEDIADDA